MNLYFYWIQGLVIILCCCIAVILIISRAVELRGHLKMEANILFISEYAEFSLFQIDTGSRDIGCCIQFCVLVLIGLSLMLFNGERGLSFQALAWCLLFPFFPLFYSQVVC